MGSAHHSRKRELPIMFAFGEAGSSPFNQLIKKEKATNVTFSFLVETTGLDGLCPSFAQARTPDSVRLRRGRFEPFNQLIKKEKATIVTFSFLWRRQGSMGSAHHSRKRELPIMFAFGEAGSSPFNQLIKKRKSHECDFLFFGGDDRARTCDPLHVKQVL